jgi:hypothetical protein
VIALAPLEAERIDRFLQQLDRVGVDVRHLNSLLENESTPLMTDVILQTYVGKAADAVAAVQVADVWDNYVARKFEDERIRQEAAGKTPLYPPAVIRKWLNWVALQLRSHTQDQHRFFVEELQPDWLPRNGMILSYAVTFGVLLAAAYLLTRFTFEAGLLILYGEEGVRNYLPDYQKISIPLGALWIVLISWVFARRSRGYAGAIMMWLLSGIVFGSMIWVPYRDMPALALVGGAITAVIAVALVRIGIQVFGYADKDIVCVKRRKWDWTKAGRGLAIGVVFVLLISLVSDTARAMFYEGMAFGPALQRSLSFDTVVWWNWGLPGLLSMSLFLLLVFGLGWGSVVLRDEVDLPNQGILDSGKNGITVAAGGVLAGLSFSLAIGLPCYLGLGFKASSGGCVYGNPSALLSGLAFGLGFGAILGLVFGLILGGLAWLRHNILRLLLTLDRHRVPWRFERFLAYAARIHLLRSVGGGFEFIDQELQAYFERGK